MLLSTRLFGNLINHFHLNVTKSIAPTLSSRFFHIFQPQIINTTKITPIINNNNNNYMMNVLNSQFLYPKNLIINQVAGFKVKGRLKRRCKDCMFVVRQQRLYVICKTHPRHKQMAMKARPDKSWILTHATQSKIRPY